MKREECVARPLRGAPPSRGHAWPTLRIPAVEPSSFSQYTSVMIVDCHAHVFENWHGACGHPSVDIHLKYIQKNVTRPAAKTFRLRDGKPASPAMLFRPDD